MTLHDTTTRRRRIVTAFGDFDRTAAWSLDITETSDSQIAAQRYSKRRRPRGTELAATKQQPSAISLARHNPRLRETTPQPRFLSNDCSAQNPPPHSNLPLYLSRGAVLASERRRRNHDFLSIHCSAQSPPPHSNLLRYPSRDTSPTTERWHPYLLSSTLLASYAIPSTNSSSSTRLSGSSKAMSIFHPSAASAARYTGI